MSRVTINVNGLSLVHEDSGGISTATLPDVCLTPPANLPVPYSNVALSRDLAGGTSSVRADAGHRIAVSGSTFGKSSGDEPGAGGGVASGVTGKEASFLSHSFDVTIEGRPACRLTDKMLHNRGNTIDCGGVHQAHAGHTHPARTRAHDAQRGKGRDKRSAWEKPLQPSHFGVDSNCRTLKVAYAKERKAKFVCRYISGLSLKEAEALVAEGKKKSISPNEIRLSDTEAQNLELPIVAIWEVNSKVTDTGPNHRAIETSSLDRQHHLGFEDGKHADRNLKEAGGGDAPIYFTVDFHVVDKAPAKPDPQKVPWGQRLQDKKTGEWITIGDLITKYFEGIARAIGMERVGVYGTYAAVRRLLDAGLARYAWQMTFNSPNCDSRAQLHQINIYPDITRWCADPRQDPSTLPIYEAALEENWGVSGAGGLDFDRAVRVDFGQWRPGKPRTF